jgi:hypothetical protein
MGWRLCFAWVCDAKTQMAQKADQRPPTALDISSNQCQDLQCGPCANPPLTSAMWTKLQHDTDYPVSALPEVRSTAAPLRLIRSLDFSLGFANCALGSFSGHSMLLLGMPETPVVAAPSWFQTRG